jgi:hypothetical protein
MPRRVTVYLLVVAVLACPYPCLARAAGGQASAIGECRDADSCCPGPRSATGRNQSGQPIALPGSGTCLCHGAVADRPVAPPDPDAGIAAFLPSDVLFAGCEPPAFERGLCTELAASHFPTANSGREVRALIASFLL